jgi:hypothetical protein
MPGRHDRGAVRLLTRTGLDWTHKYPAIASALSYKQEKRTKARLDRRQPSLLLPGSGGGKRKEDPAVGRTAIASGRRKNA